MMAPLLVVLGTATLLSAAGSASWARGVPAATSSSATTLSARHLDEGVSGASCTQAIFNIGGPQINDQISNRTFCSGRLVSASQGFADTISTADNVDPTYWATSGLYATAEAKADPFTLKYFVNVSRFTPLNGAAQMWLRLHFAAFKAGPPYSNPQSSRFDAVANGIVLLTNFSVTSDAVLFARLNGQTISGEGKAVMKEFLLPAANTLDLSLTPRPGSYAFINGIEVIPLPPDAIYSGAAYFASSTQPPSRGSISITQSFAVKYRIQTSTMDVVPASKDDLSRTWINADRFQAEFFGKQTFLSSVENANQPPYYVPPDVASYSRILKDVNVPANISYTFVVPPGASYWLRLFFSESKYNQAGQRILAIYVNGRTMAPNYDIYRAAGHPSAIIALDLVYQLGDSETNLTLDIGTAIESTYSDPCLTAAEISRIGNTSLASDSDGTYAGSPVPQGPGTPATAPTSATSASSTSDTGSSVSTGLLVLAILGGIVAAFFLFGVTLGVYLWWVRRHQCSPGADGGSGSGEVDSDLWIHSGTKDRSVSSVDDTDSTKPMAGSGSRKGKGRGSLFSFGALRPSSGSTGSSTSDKAIDGPSTPLWREYSLRELQRATGNWDDVNVLGEGGFGTVYYGKLGSGQLIAVKRARDCSEQGNSEFETEVVLLSKLRHNHLVSLFGVCTEGRELILVYEFMGQGTLRRHLYGSNLPPLSWKRRLEAAIGAARGLHYLHTGFSAPIIHRDVKSTNILLDNNFVAKLSDFGLSKLGPSSSGQHVSTQVKGSFGYLDPEYFKRQQLTEKSDVYSFGVVLLELLCARPAIDTDLPREEASLADWGLKMAKEGRVEEIVDRRLLSYFGEESMERFVDTAMRCLADYGEDRPSMGTVLFELESSLKAVGSVSSLAIQKEETNSREGGDV